MKQITQNDKVECNLDLVCTNWGMSANNAARNHWHEYYKSSKASGCDGLFRLVQNLAKSMETVSQIT